MATRGLSSHSASTGLDEIASIDWRVPWLNDWAQVGEPLAQAALSLAEVREPSGEPVDSHCVADALNLAAGKLAGGLPVAFVAQAGLPQGMAYEAFIRANGRVPTRDNAHDFFNGLAWLHMPRVKQKLNALQSAEIEAMGIGSTRGPVRDAITVLDENGAFMVAPPQIWAALRARRWHDLFVELRADWRACRLWPFGHALPEKLIRPRKNIVAHVLAMELPQLENWAALDEWVAAALDDVDLAVKPFLPLPVMGIPGWCSENENPDFYADANVFRP